MSQPDELPSRSRIFVPLAGAEVQTYHFDLDGPRTITSVQSEAAYVTPRFPEGIRVSALPDARSDIQRETMAYWFLANFVPADKTNFGFVEVGYADSQAPLVANAAVGRPAAPTLPVVGFDDGTWFQDGERSEPALLEEFGEHVGSGVVAETASLFGGMWQRLPPDAAANPVATADHLKTSLGLALDTFEAMFRPFVPEHGGMGHNGPPDGPLSSADTVVVLRAVADMKMAILSNATPTVLDTIWSSVSDVMGRLGAWSLKQSEVFFVNFTPAAGKSIGVAAPILIAGVSLWYAGATVSNLIALAAKLAK